MLCESRVHPTCALSQLESITKGPILYCFVIITKCLEVRLPYARTQSDRRRLGSVTLARARVRVRAGYEFVSCRRHGDQRLRGPVTGPIATSFFRQIRG